MTEHTIDAEPDLLTVEAETQAIEPADLPAEETVIATIEEPAPPAVAQSTAVASASATVMNMIAAAAADPRVDPAKMRELLDLRREIVRDEAAVEARRAFARVCRNMPRIIKKGAIDFGKGQKPIPYAKWEDVVEVIRPIYEQEDFTLSFNTHERTGGGLVVTALLQHDNGHVISSEFPVPLDTSGGKQNIQGMGSSGSYGQRYATKNLFNLTFESEDDDGNLGSVTFITKEEAEEIAVLVDEVVTDIDAFMTWVFGDNAPHTFGEIPKAKFVKVKNALIQKRAQNAKTAGGAA